MYGGYTRCIDDNNKYKLYGYGWRDKISTIQIEVAACDPNARADPSTCESDEAKVREYIDSVEFRLYTISNLKNYNTQEY